MREGVEEVVERGGMVIACLVGELVDGGVI